jgi:hypothetical protein
MKLREKMLVAIGITAFAYITHKFAKVIFAVKGISENLPEYVKNSFGEKPKLTMQIVFNKCDIILDLKKKTIEKNKDLEEQINEYIEHFYPEILKLKLKVEIRERIEIDDLEEENLAEDQVTEDLEESEEK